MSALLGAMVLSSAVFAAEAPEKHIGDIVITAKKELPWYSILECRNIKTKQIVIVEKSKGSVSFTSPTYADIRDRATGNAVYVFAMGADVICKFMDKETYEKRN